MALPTRESRAAWDGQLGGPHIGHDHFWTRALSRRRLLGNAAMASGAAMTAGLWLPTLANAAPLGHGTPRPIPQTLDDTPFHVQLPGPGVEPSLISDFAGWVGITDILGTAAGGPNDPTGLTYDADMRFMSGRFVGTDGQVHVGTFGFI
ncbi:MAG TPA: hypothetical protein VGL99_16730 [Chloroflexota bacterium]